MTTHDLDRRLDDFFAEGTSRAPDRTVDAALAHARVHPRRRDPLRSLRRDPMAAPWFGGSPVARGLVLVAVLAALIAGSLAVAAVGGLLERPAVVPPPAPSESAPTTPSVAPSPSPSPSAAVVTVDLVEVNGNDASIAITDESGRLLEARSGQPADGGSVATGTVAVAAVDERSVSLTWTGPSCTTLHALTIDPDGRTLTLEQPSCQGDAMPRDLVLVLVFGEPVVPETLVVTVEPATQP